MTHYQVLECFYLHGAIVYVDDTVIYEKIKKMDMVLARMAQFHVRLKPKGFFGMQSVEFLGYIFDENGVHLRKDCREFKIFQRRFRPYAA